MNTLQTLTISRTTMMVWLAMLCVTIGATTAFHSRSPIAMVSQTTDRRNRLKRRKTTLAYSDSNDYNNGSSGSDTVQQSGWWRSLLSSPSYSAGSVAGAAATTAASPSGEATQQETVDAYLEFLDRRYRRLHSSEMEEERKKKQQQEHASSSSSSAKKSVPFSAMDWLMNGSSSTSTHSATAQSLAEEQRKHEDALYVLGVAGLASQKLLQKHHLPVNPETPAAVSEAASSMDVIEVQAEAEDETMALNGSTQTTPSHIFIKKVLVPIIRAMYIVQRYRNSVVSHTQRTIGAVTSRVARRVLYPAARQLRKGPKAIVASLLEIGGGKRNVAITLACGYATIVVLRPILQAAITEASVGP